MDIELFWISREAAYPTIDDCILTGGYFYVRGANSPKMSIRFYDDTVGAWYLPTNKMGFTPNNSFDMWLLPIRQAN